MANNDQPRTNNSKKAFLKPLQSVTNSHPTPRGLIECLLREKALATKRLVDLRIGSDERKQIYRHINDKLEMIVENISACLDSFYVDNA